MEQNTIKIKPFLKAGFLFFRFKIVKSMNLLFLSDAKIEIIVSLTSRI
ncbi:MAG: hypothetical protein ACJA1D_000180 [Polaribacter sp.]|jgi:hypothetical protein